MNQTPASFIKQLFFWPSKNISLTMALTLIVGFVIGLGMDTSPLKHLILPVTFIMIYPSMIGFNARDIFNLSHGKLLAVVILINFLFVPALAYLLGTQFLLNDPQLFAGLAITALLPTSNMTIVFTMISRGNVTASIKMTTLGLLLGSILAPWYLYFMVGKYVPVDILSTSKTIVLVIAIPLILGMLTYKYLTRNYSQEYFEKQIKPYFPAVSSWGMILIIFISVSMSSPRISSNLDVFLVAFLVQLMFYAANYIIAVCIGRKCFEEQDSLTLVFSTVLRNLSISIGLAATAFGPNAALMVSLAFLIQGQTAAWFIKLNEKYGLLRRAKN